MKKSQHILTTISAALLLSVGFASTAFASGSIGAPSSVGPDNYAMGKSIFFKKVVCSNCPYASRGKDATDAKQLRDQLNAADSKLKLDADEKASLNSYLNERFRLSAVAMADKK